MCGYKEFGVFSACPNQGHAHFSKIHAVLLKLTLAFKVLAPSQTLIAIQREYGRNRKDGRMMVVLKLYIHSKTLFLVPEFDPILHCLPRFNVHLAKIDASLPLLEKRFLEVTFWSLGASEFRVLPVTRVISWAMTKKTLALYVGRSPMGIFTVTYESPV